MTTREFYVAVAGMENVSDELVEFANAAIEKIDRTNAAHQAKAAEKRAAQLVERAPIVEALYAAVSSVPMTAAQLIEAAGVDVKPTSVPSLLRNHVALGKVVKTDIKVPGKGKVRGYVLP